MSSPETPAVKVEGIVKRYKSVEALKGVSFQIPGNSVFCILGPNGAGKTTLLKILTTITRPDAGTAFIEGFNIITDVLQVRQQIGVVAQDNHFDQYLTVWHNLTLHAQMHGIPKATYEARITELLKRVELYDRRFALLDQLSGGMQRRIALIRALIHQPKVLFLDEPTTGLDPEARIEIWKMIELFKQSATVILTTHYMDEADRLSDTILMMNQGSIVAQGTAAELKHQMSPLQKFEIVFFEPKAAAYFEKLQAELRQMADYGGISQLEIGNTQTLTFQLSSPDRLAGILTLVAPEDLLRIGRKEVDLEDVFLSISSQNGLKRTPEKDPV